MINTIDNKTVFSNQNTAAATVAPAPFANTPAKADDILPNMASPTVSDAGVRTAQWLKGFVSANKDHFVNPTSSQTIGADCWGRLMPNGCVAIIGSVLSQQMEKAGLAIKLPQFAAWADENGLLQRGRGGDGYFMNMRFGEATHRVLVINIDGISTPEDSTGITF